MSLLSHAFFYDYCNLFVGLYHFLIHLGSESCSSSHLVAPCLTFWLKNHDSDLDNAVKVLAEKICPILFETIIQGIFLAIISSMEVLYFCFH